jgi:hypothetical protein
MSSSGRLNGTVRRMNVVLRVAAAGLAAPLLMLAGCGMEAAPLPPSLKLPQPVTDLAGARAGDEVRLHWMMPKRDTDKVLLKRDQQVRVCRRVETGPCETAGEFQTAPNAAASYVDHLPPKVISGSPQLLVYTVELLNHLGHDAGPSNQVYATTGAAPPKIENFSATASADGIVLRWNPVAGTVTDQELIRIHRVLVVDPKAQKPNQMAGSPAPQEQTLEVTGADRGQALDRDAALDNVYRYTAERVRKFTLQGHAFEETSALSEIVNINARDVFPPHTPVGVQAVADPEARAIDLSWPPNTDQDIAGYIVYRREAGSTANPVRVSPPGSVAPSFRDASALPGHSYVYSVSAIDRDGNESARSAEIEESLPQQ